MRTEQRPAARPAGLPEAERSGTWTRVVPGLAAAGGLAAVATALGGLAPVLGAPVLAIVGGLALRARARPPERLAPGLRVAARHVLQASIVVLGLQLSVSQVAATGVGSLPVLAGTLVLALGAAALLGRRLRLPRDLTTLIGVGTAICGASAIAATDAVLGAAEADVSYAVATIFTFNVAAVLTYPVIGHALGLSQHAFGLWAGTAVNDTSSVVAAASIFGGPALATAVVVKLTRSLAIIPVCAALAAWRSARRRPALHRIVPPFLVLFGAAVLVNSAGGVPASWHRGLGDLATWMITAALGAIGLSTDTTQLRRAGARPLILGALLWGSVAGASLALQWATGTA